MHPQVLCSKSSTAAVVIRFAHICYTCCALFQPKHVLSSSQRQFDFLLTSCYQVFTVRCMLHAAVRCMLHVAGTLRSSAALTGPNSKSAMLACDVKFLLA